MKFNTPGSSNIESMDYDERSEELIINFRTGASYGYAGVSLETWEAFKASDSYGKFFAENIKGKHSFRKIQ